MIIDDERDIDEENYHYGYNVAVQMSDIFQDDILITEEAFNIRMEHQLSF